MKWCFFLLSLICIHQSVCLRSVFKQDTLLDNKVDGEDPSVNIENNNSNANLTWPWAKLTQPQARFFRPKNGMSYSSEIGPGGGWGWMDDDDDEFDKGLLGLAGLSGLKGLKGVKAVVGLLLLKKLLIPLKITLLILLMIPLLIFKLMLPLLLLMIPMSTTGNNGTMGKMILQESLNELIAKIPKDLEHIVERINEKISTNNEWKPQVGAKSEKGS